MVRVPVVLVLILGLAAGPAAPAIARAGPGAPQWTLEPAAASDTTPGRAFFDYSLAAGTAIQDEVRLSNLSDRAVEFTLYAADAYTTTQGAFALRLQDQPRRGVGAWVSLPFTTRTVPAATAITFSFQLGVPAGTAPGDWAGGIVAVANDPGAPPRTGSQLVIEQGVGTRIYVRVKGAVQPALSVHDLALHMTGGAWSPLGGSGHATLSYNVVNDGNVRLSGTASGKVIDALGRTVKVLASRPLPELLPGDKVDITEEWGGLAVAGLRYRPEVTVTAPGIRIEVTGATRWHVPVTIALAAVALLVAVIVLGLRVARSVARRRGRAKAVVVA